jgi:hypothetical protein
MFLAKRKKPEVEMGDLDNRCRALPVGWRRKMSNNYFSSRFFLFYVNWSGLFEIKFFEGCVFYFLILEPNLRPVLWAKARA